MPLAQAVDYGLTAVVFNITQPGSWLPDGQSTNLELPSEMPDRLLPSQLNVIQVRMNLYLPGDPTKLLQNESACPVLPGRCN